MKAGNLDRLGVTYSDLFMNLLGSWLHVAIVKLTYNIAAAPSQNVKISLFHSDLALFKHITHVNIDYNVSYLFSSVTDNVMVTMCFSEQLHCLTLF